MCAKLISEIKSQKFYSQGTQSAKASNVGPCFNQAELVQIRRRRRRLGSRERQFQWLFNVSRESEVGRIEAAAAGAPLSFLQTHFILTDKFPTRFHSKLQQNSVSHSQLSMEC